MKNEWDRDEIAEVYENNNFVICKAECAGAGKTSSFKHYGQGRRMLIVCPYNNLCCVLKSEGFQAITLNKLLGLRISGTQERYDSSVEKEGSAFDIDVFDIIVFDEIYLYQTDKLERIWKFVKNNSDKKIYATGDEFQLTPIEELNISDKKAYYNSIINSMFGTQICLKENKRCKTEEDRRRMKEISDGIRLAETKEEALLIILDNFKHITSMGELKTKFNVCGWNSTTEMVNNYLHEYKEKQKYYLGLEVIGRKTVKNKDYKIAVNYTYSIVEIADSAIIVFDGEENFSIPKTKFDELFKLSYGRTCHSMQGLSVDEDITIFDATRHTATVQWLYTAITRTTDLSKITIYLGEYATAQ